MMYNMISMIKDGFLNIDTKLLLASIEESSLVDKVADGITSRMTNWFVGCLNVILETASIASKMICLICCMVFFLYDDKKYGSKALISFFVFLVITIAIGGIN